MSIRNRAIGFRKQLDWLVIALISVAVLAFGSFVRDNKRAEVDADAAKTSDNRRTLIETEIVTVTSRGFEPAAINRPQGKFILMVDNRTGDELNFRFSRETNESFHDIRSSRQEPNWNEALDLKPGRYLLTEVNHPSWTCNVVISAN